MQGLHWKNKDNQVVPLRTEKTFLNHNFQVMERVKIRDRYSGAGLCGTLRARNKIFPTTWLVAMERGDSVKLEWREESAFEWVAIAIGR